MKKQILSIVFILALFLFSEIKVQATEVQEATLSVEVSLNSDVEPDTATVRFYVENSGTNLKEIKEKNDKIVNNAINEIKKKLNSNETVKTIAYRVNNVYSYKDKIRIFQLNKHRILQKV